MCWIFSFRADATRKAAKRFFRKLLKGLHYVPRVIITDTLRSYGAAKREILPGVEHWQHKGLNNRAENSQQPTRLREKKMRTFKSARAGTTLSLGLWTHRWAFPTATTPLVCQGIPRHFTGPILGVERDTCSETRRITINPAPYFIVFSLFPLSISAIYCVPTNKLTISMGWFLALVSLFGHGSSSQESRRQPNASLHKMT